MQSNLFPYFFPIIYVSEDLSLNSIFSSLIQTPNSYQLLSYFYIPDNFKQSSTGPILHEDAVPQTEGNRFLIVLQAISR